MKSIISSVVIATLLTVGSSAWADFFDIYTAPTIDPANGQYVAAGDIAFPVPGGTVVLSGLSLENLRPQPVGNGNDFPAQSFFDIFVDVTLPTGPNGPVSGHGETDISGGNSGVGLIGTFPSYPVTSLFNLTLPNGDQIRIDPAQPTTGSATITDNGNGSYRISSFFDVFTELSLDGGNTWIPSTGGAAVMNLEPAVPEPATIISGALMLLPFGASTLRMLRKRQLA
jgi:hypothetical protein